MEWFTREGLRAELQRRSGRWLKEDGTALLGYGIFLALEGIEAALEERIRRASEPRSPETEAALDEIVSRGAIGELRDMYRRVCADRQAAVEVAEGAEADRDEAWRRTAELQRELDNLKREVATLERAVGEAHDNASQAWQQVATLERALDKLKNERSAPAPSYSALPRLPDPEPADPVRARSEVLVRCDNHPKAKVDYDRHAHGGCPFCQLDRLSSSMDKRVEELKAALRRIRSGIDDQYLDLEEDLFLHAFIDRIVGESE